MNLEEFILLSFHLWEKNLCKTEVNRWIRKQWENCLYRGILGKFLVSVLPPEEDCICRGPRSSPVPIILQEFSDRIQKLFLWVSHDLVQRTNTTVNWKQPWSFYWLTFLASFQGEEYSNIWKMRLSVLSIPGRGQANGMNWLQVSFCGWLLCWCTIITGFLVKYERLQTVHIHSTCVAIVYMLRRTVCSLFCSDLGKVSCVRR